jgi:prevent-host-death family protein
VINQLIDQLRRCDVEHTVNATEARIRFGELMRDVVEKGETIIVERGGKPHVVVLSIEAYQRLVSGQREEHWQELVDRARAQVRADLAGRKLPSVDEILAQAREERDAQLLDLC